MIKYYIDNTMFENAEIIRLVTTAIMELQKTCRDHKLPNDADSEIIETIETGLQETIAQAFKLQEMHQIELRERNEKHE